MKELTSTALRYQNGTLQVLDQQKLPHKELWITCNVVEDMRDCIVQLKVRGAPLIGVAAVLMLAQLIEQGKSNDEVKQAAIILRQARPTAVNLMICIDRMMQSFIHSRQAAVDTAITIFEEDVELCEKIAQHGAQVIQDNENVMTHCNSGSLATAGIGTAFGTIYKAFRQGKKIHVYANETRPLLQGGRLTAWELRKANIPYTLLCDNMAGYLMAQGKVDRILLGSDRIAINGDIANKIGTYSLAVLAKHHHIPFYVVAPYTTIDPECRSGAEIHIEQRAADEVRGAAGDFGKVIWSPTDSPVYNPAFDVTPAYLITGYIMDKGVFSQEDVKRGILSKCVA